MQLGRKKSENSTPAEDDRHAGRGRARVTELTDVASVWKYYGLLKILHFYGSSLKYVYVNERGGR